MVLFKSSWVNKYGNHFPYSNDDLNFHPFLVEKWPKTSKANLANLLKIGLINLRLKS